MIAIETADMINRLKKFLICLTLAIFTVGCLHSWQGPVADIQSPPATISHPSGKQQGVSWVGGPEEVTLEDFSPLVENHVNWIVQTPFGWQEDYDSPELLLKTDGIYWGETDTGLEKTTELAQSLGIQTLLKPHIWLTNARDGKWRTEIEMGSEQDWQTWFENYRRFILHYAKFAEEHGIPILCIGTELQTTAVQREQDWRQLIADIREVYQGQLTYAANWYEAFEAIQFWDTLDFIGIQAYFPLTDQMNPAVEELKEGWRPHLAAIEVVQARYQKPVIFTELGYRSEENAAIEPWKWPEDSEVNPGTLATDLGLKTQMDCYEAFFETLWDKEWFAGVYFWKWFPKLGDEAAAGIGFTPQNKPAEGVMRRWYGAANLD